ncbi:hypothetical protein B0H15DRAFT_147115 [Mycena belliarum]|uniref:Vacuolar protein sorting-associated protein 13 second N-terminal domain-containing protein n=1 Tax=Mycena belliarum TaxID=1033014 RepID=A0AAD6U8X7_9AGAR|nr:hypothetical protein B0H15DRAFT_147115 [Mycena belliae]
MPMPKLLKKISRKNLRHSRSSDGSESTEQKVPPIPPVRYSNYDGSYATFSPSHYDSAKSSPNGSPRPRIIELERSASDSGYYELPPSTFGRDSTGRKPSLTGYVENLPSRHPSHNSSEYSIRPRTTPQASPVKNPGYFDLAPSPSSPRPRTASHTSSPRPGASERASPGSPYSDGYGDPYAYRGRPGFVSSPSQLAYSHADPSYSFRVDENPSTNTPADDINAKAPPSRALLASSQSTALPEADSSKDLAGTWTIATTAPKVSKTDKVLAIIENGVIGAQTNQMKANVVMHGITVGLEAVGGMEAIQKGLNRFMEGMPVLMNALDEVAKLHPFIGVAVMAFKAVWALEQKRRDNDRKILALHMEMKEMMGVLTQLKNVKDADETAPDGTTIKGRMQEIVKVTAEDIKACANACDTYTKKKLVVKILKGPVWEGKLVKFAGTFTKRRSEFEFALSIHTALGVDAANKTLGSVDQTTQEMNKKMDMMMKMFQQFVGPEEKEMLRVVEQKGGLQACQENDKVLKELSDLEAKSTSTGGVVQPAKSGAKSSALEDLKDDLMSDIDSAMEKNMTVFTRKFEVQKRQIVDELTKVVEREGDRVISAVTAGPHDKIIDPDVHKIWKEMGWRGSVKSRHFVMAVRDYYQEGADDADTAAVTGKKRNPDDWALAYLNVSRLQSISEAFDDDASGFITVAEANTFTTSRPLGWSLPVWISFWAIGFHQSMSIYAVKIRELIAKMFALRTLVLPANRTAVNSYLETIYNGVTSLESGLAACYVNDALQEKFSSYVEAEEARLRGNLEAVDYDLDAANTLTLVTGQGRIERFLFPVIYLLLKRDFEIFRICQKKVIHPDELWDAADTMGWVISAAKERADLLESTFQQQKVDIAQEFKTYAHGIFQFLTDPSGLWDAKVVLAQEFPDYPYDDALESQDVDMQKVLNYPIGIEKLDFAAYNPELDIITKSATPPSRPSSALKTMLGSWNGFTYSPASSIVPSSGMISMELVAGGSRRFQASSRSNTSDFSISGECSGEDTETVKFTFKRTFPARFSPEYFSGSWSRATQSLSGTWGPEADTRTHEGVFVFKRILPEDMCFFPSPAVLQGNKPRSLWAFAIAAVRHRIRREDWSWSFFKQRTLHRKRFIELYIRSTRFGRPLSRAEEEELGLIKKSFTTADSRFYHSIAENQIRVTTGHDVQCDACTGTIGGCRVTCLTCRLEDTFDTVDFCDNSSCTSMKVVPSGMTRPHLPTHDILKLRRVVHLRQSGKMYREAKRALARARQLFPPTEAEEDNCSPEKLAAPRPKCAACHVPVTQPCWYCVNCDQPSFICIACEAGTKKKKIFGYHMDTHDLVRVQPLVEEVEITLEGRLADLEQRFIQHEANMDQRLGSLEAKVDDRLLKVDDRLIQVEKLLERVLLALESQHLSLIKKQRHT